MKYSEVTRDGIQEHRYPVVFENLSVRNDYPHTVAVLSYFGSVGWTGSNLPFSVFQPMTARTEGLSGFHMPTTWDIQHGSCLSCQDSFSYRDSLTISSASSMLCAQPAIAPVLRIASRNFF
jgi:hypothetical protein